MASLTKEEIIKNAAGAYNQLFELYLNNLDDSSNNIYLAKALINYGNIDENKMESQTRLKQIRIACALLEQAISLSKENIKKKDYILEVTSKNNLKIAYEYLVSFYLDIDLLPNCLKENKKYLKDIKFGNNKKGFQLLEEGYNYSPNLKLLYLILLYDQVFQKQNINKITQVLESLDIEENYQLTEYAYKLGVISGELLIKDGNKKLINKLLEVGLKLDSDIENLYYFKAIVDELKKEEYIKKYLSICESKQLEVLDPFDIINE